MCIHQKILIMPNVILILFFWLCCIPLLCSSFLARVQDVSWCNSHHCQLEWSAGWVLSDPWAEPTGWLCGATRGTSKPSLLQHHLWCHPWCSRNGHQTNLNCCRGIGGDDLFCFSPLLQVQLDVDVFFIQDTLKGNDTTEIRVKLKKKLEDAVPAGEDWFLVLVWQQDLCCVCPNCLLI